METNLFSMKLFSMSIDSIKQLKSVLVKSMEDNLQSIEEKLAQAFPHETDHKLKMPFISECFREKQQQVDNQANFILQFLSSLQDVFEELNFKDKKIGDLKKTLIEQSDFTLKLQDQIQQYKDKLLNAEDYIHWMEEQMQYFDLLYLSNHKSQKQNVLSKCRSQKTLNSSQLFLQNETSQRKKKLDYQRLKFYIENLKEQKNHLIREYNALVDEHERKLFECEKHSILLDELFEKYKTGSTLQQFQRAPIYKQRNPQNTDFIRRSLSQKNLTNPEDSEVSVCVFQNPHQNEHHSFHHIPQESSLRPYVESNRHCLKHDNDESFTEGTSVLQSFISDVYYKHHIKMDVGVNTKKAYCVSTQCQTLPASDEVSKKQNIDFKRKSLMPKTRLSQKPTMEDSMSTQNQDIQCQISINLKNLSNQEIKNIDFSKLISRQILGQKNQSRGYTLCHRQKKKGSKHLCQHIYCFLTNKVVTQRIKTYKYQKK